MVNFKASGHQGERKRAQATQGLDNSSTVSKLEKLKLRADDIKCVNPDGIALRVVAREKVLGGESNLHMKAALVAPETMVRISGVDVPRSMLCRPGGDFVLSARGSDKAAEHEVLLGEAQRLSLHVCEGEYYEWVPFHVARDEDGTCSCELASLTVECQLMHAPKDGVPIVCDATLLGSRISKWLFDEVVTDNEIFIVTLPEEGTQLVLRVTSCTLPERDDDDDDDDAGDEDGTKSQPHVITSDHCFRGLVSGRTRVYACRSTVFASSVSQRAVCDGLHLSNISSPPDRAPRNVVSVTTRDGEVFPVRRRLLKPCISLTKAVRDIGTPVPEAHVDVDCATFDRVLLFLESAHRGAADEHAFDMLTLPDMAAAANSLGCRALRESCERKLGAFEERIQVHRWADVVAHNQAGGCWVTMDGMVFDLEAWLPEHPGGATIIPQQALNVDCTVFFELYHASRESFTYLKEFYIGELHLDDRPLVPRGDEAPSADFMQQCDAPAATHQLRRTSCDAPAATHQLRRTSCSMLVPPDHPTHMVPSVRHAAPPAP